MDEDFYTYNDKGEYVMKIIHAQSDGINSEFNF